MTTLAVDSPLTMVTGDFNSIGIIANDIVFEGAMVGDNVAGYGRPLMAGDVFLGHALMKVDNSGGGLAGAKEIRLRTGRYRGIVTLAGVLITDVGKEVYASDDATLTLSGSGNTRVGVVIRYDSTNKAIVEFQTNEPFAESGDGEITYGDLVVGGSYQGLYEQDTTKNYQIGTRRKILGPDGRVFRYGKSSGACYTGRGAGFCQDKAISANCAVAVLSGASTITFASQTFDEDELKGGFIVVFGGTPNDANCPFRRIIGNTVCTDSIVTITVDYAFDRDIDEAQFCEVFYNSYAKLKTLCDTTGTGIVSFAGVSNIYVEDADSYFWTQTWGPCWNAPQTATFGGGIARDAYFREDGTICALDDSVTKSTAKQRAGFIIPPGFTAGPLLMLQISP